MPLKAISYNNGEIHSSYSALNFTTLIQLWKNSSIWIVMKIDCHVMETLVNIIFLMLRPNKDTRFLKMSSNLWLIWSGTRLLSHKNEMNRSQFGKVMFLFEFWLTHLCCAVAGGSLQKVKFRNLRIWRRCSFWHKFWNFRFLYDWVSRSFECHFWQILANFKIFSRFQNKEKLFYTWEHSDARNQNVNKFVIRISAVLKWDVLSRACYSWSTFVVWRNLSFEFFVQATSRKLFFINAEQWTRIDISKFRIF